MWRLTSKAPEPRRRRCELRIMSLFGRQAAWGSGTELLLTPFSRKKLKPLSSQVAAMGRPSQDDKPRHLGRGAYLLGYGQDRSSATKSVVTPYIQAYHCGFQWSTQSWGSGWRWLSHEEKESQ
ncbi:hypothetical protein NDU88_001734 [Pleurodeles waltl]|uniref:Uncharacterized protein n=1 Tax=Pleurodeles waltl TaxID=8319 RepID=A0AAV7VCS3_PLEWA|nr:hypothetical protein NDU88_001734 [Pleurodeles waltl]